MSGISIDTIITGQLKQNCYVLSIPRVGEILIDPGADEETILDRVKKRDIKYIVNTHGHYDHIGAVSAVKNKFSAPFLLHGADIPLLKQANIYRFLFASRLTVTIPEVDGDLSNPNDPLLINFDNFGFSVLETPGHTPGSVCLKIQDSLFSGDTLLFPGSVAINLPGFDPALLESSINLLRRLPEETKVYPGHGSPFYLGEFLSKYDAK